MVSGYEIVELARKSGKIEKGVNEVTKSVERGNAKCVIVAEDVEPKEITQHLPLLCQEKGISFVTVDSKKKLGVSAGINVGTSSIAVVEAGDASRLIAELKKQTEKPTEKPHTTKPKEMKTEEAE